jgi:DNA-binding NarL/FixJ family response regulator
LAISASQYSVLSHRVGPVWAGQPGPLPRELFAEHGAGEATAQTSSAGERLLGRGSHSFVRSRWGTGHATVSQPRPGRTRSRRKPQSATLRSNRPRGVTAAGMTNRDVAAALFISPKSVEANLGCIYRKLGITSRAELGRLIGEL